MLLIMHEGKSVFRLCVPKGRIASHFSLALLLYIGQPEFHKKCHEIIS